MPPKQQKQKAPVGYKAAALAKDILPPSVKNPPREGKSVKIPDAAAIQQNQVVANQLNAPLFEEYPKIEEWPGDDAAKNFDFNIEGTTNFVDQNFSTNKLTPSFVNDNTNLIFWRRPTEFIQIEQEELQTIQNKYNIKRRTSYYQTVVSEEHHIKKKEEFQHSPLKGIHDEPTKLQVKVFEYYEREETQQEFEQRKKEQMEKEEKEKKTKKPAKKVEQVEDKPGLVKDIKLNSIDLSYQYPSDSKWIASQLQLIKDRNIRDCYTNKPLHSKIYPQQDNIPVYNKTGRYWVKLYYLGKERKIEIDDKMPVNFKGQCKFPRSVKKEEIWTCIISKAIFKLMQISQDITCINNLCGSGFVMYTLTGMLSQSIPMQINPKSNSEWQNKLNFIREMLNDKHYLDQDILVTCYSEPGFQPKIEQGQNNSRLSVVQQKKSKDSSELAEQIKEESPIDRRKSQDEEQVHLKHPKMFVEPIKIPQRGRESADSSNDDANQRSPYKRKQQRNMTTGGIARYSTQIFDQMHKGMHDPHMSGIEAEEEEAANNSMSIQNQSMSPTKKQNPMLLEIKKASSIIQQTQKNIPTNVISGFAYPLIECFYNDTFNMVYVQKRTDKEIKLRQEYIELSNQSINKMSKEEKIEHRKKKKDIRDKIGDEDKKRIELITRPPIQYKYFRLKSGAGKVPQISILTPFSNDEILIAKTCIVNKLNKPPNYQDGAEIRDDGKSIVSSVMKNQEETLQMKPLDDFSSVNNFVEPLNKGQGGVWILDNDLIGCFQNFQIFYNPTKFPHHKTINIAQAVDSEITTGEDNEVLLVERNDNKENPDEDVQMLFGFTAKESKTAKIVPEPYCILQKFDFGSFSAIHEFQPLKGNQSSQMITLDNSNQVFKILVYTPVSFSLNISCHNSFRTMSVLNYLTEYEGYNVKNFNIEYLAMEEKKYHVFFRFRIPQQEHETLFLMKVKSTTDNHMLKYLRLKLVEEDSEGQGVMLNTIQGVNKNLYESTFSLSNYLRLSIREHTNYYLVLEGEPPYSIAEGALQVDFYYKNPELTFENLEHVEPLQYIEKYIPTKYGIIFREKLYVGEQTIASFHLKIMDIIGQVAQQVDPKKKAGKPSGNDQGDVQEKEIEEKHLVKLELFENGQSIIYNIGHNQTLFSNVILKSTKNEEVQYLLEATFDLRDWPDAKTLNKLTENIHWLLKIVSTETIALIKDTDKEDREKAIKKSWEDGEPGRADKSKKSRKKFLALIKQSNGEKLTEEETQLLNEPRLSKKQREEQAQQAQAGGKKQPKKEEKKPPVKGKGKEEVVEEKKEIRPTPQSQNHRTNEIKAFLEHMEQERVSEHLADHPGLIQIRSEENKLEIRENALMAKEEVAAIFQRNMQLREELKQYQLEQIKRIQAFMQGDRAAFKENWQKFIETREEVKSKMSAKTQKEKEFIDILKAEKASITLNELEKLINDSQNIPDLNEQLIETSKKLLKNLRIQALTDKMNESLNTFNVDSLNNCFDDYKKFSVTGIDAELIKRVEDMIAEAKDNPNYTQEKLLEQKKAGKKGKR
ncbi:hypothetical protein ABPG74_002387 [Tetrahymena malaccensis]